METNDNVNINIRGRDTSSQALDKGAAGARRLRLELTSLQGVAAKLTPTITGLFSAAVIGKGISFAIGEFTGAQKAATQLTAALKSTGGAARLTFEDIDALAEAMQKTTRFDDDSIVDLSSKFLRFKNITGETFKEAIRLSADLAVRMDTDLTNAATLVGKALNNPAQGLAALNRAGIQFTQTQKDLIQSLVQGGNAARAQQVILEELRKQFGGAAQADAATFGGQMAQMKNEVANLAESIGKDLVPVIKELFGLFKNADGMGIFSDAMEAMRKDMQTAERILKFLDKMNYKFNPSSPAREGTKDPQADIAKRIYDLSNEHRALRANLNPITDLTGERKRRMAELEQEIGRLQKVYRDNESQIAAGNVDTGMYSPEEVRRRVMGALFGERDADRAAIAAFRGGTSQRNRRMRALFGNPSLNERVARRIFGAQGSLNDRVARRIFGGQSIDGAGGVDGDALRRDRGASSFSPTDSRFQSVGVGFDPATTTAKNTTELLKEHRQISRAIRDQLREIKELNRKQPRVVGKA